MKKCLFTYEHYRETIKIAQQHYQFVSFQVAERSDMDRKSIVLRHDVDFSLKHALKLAIIEAEERIQSTYFVCPHWDYNIFGGENFTIVRKILDLGHHLGIHFDRSVLEATNRNVGKTIRIEAKHMEEHFETEVFAFSEHNPGIASTAGQVEVDGMVDAYSPLFTEDMKYLSDSCQNWREGCFCNFIVASGPRQMQILIHPIWWSKNGESADKILHKFFQECIGGCNQRRRDVFFYYAGLKHLKNRCLFMAYHNEIAE